MSIILGHYINKFSYSKIEDEFIPEIYTAEIES